MTEETMKNKHMASILGLRLSWPISSGSTVRPWRKMLLDESTAGYRDLHHLEAFVRVRVIAVQGSM
jgi:hypothetical protein